jgi:hypothetical protein
VASRGVCQYHQALGLEEYHDLESASNGSSSDRI